MLDSAPEAPVRLELNGRHVLTWLCTPERVEALAAGWLRGEGIIRTRSEIHAIEITQDPVRARVQIAPDALLRLPLRSPDRAAAPGPSTLPPREIFPEPRRLSSSLADLLADGERLRSLFAEMYERGVLRERGGGVHTGGLVTERRLREVAEDVGRQNVVDKLIGRAVLDGRSLRDSLLLLSGRISGVIAAKAWRSGVAALASLSIPTTLACDVARRAGVTLVGRARSAEPQIHWPS